MKLLFISDVSFFRDGNIVYNGGGIPNTVWENNYLPYFDTVSVIGRLSNNMKDKVTISSLDDGRVNFVLLSEYNSVINLFLNYSLIKEKIGNEILKNDVVIARVPFQFAFIAIHVLKKLEKPFLIEVASNGFETYLANG
jgi:hypothetical protein